MRQLNNIPKTIKLIAWTGGNRPDKRRNVSQLERDLITFLFRQQAEAFTSFWINWQTFDDKWDVARLYYRRAKYDAYATIREMERSL